MVCSIGPRKYGEIRLKGRREGLCDAVDSNKSHSLHQLEQVITTPGSRPLCLIVINTTTGYILHSHWRCPIPPLTQSISVSSLKSTGNEETFAFFFLNWRILYSVKSCSSTALLVLINYLRVFTVCHLNILAERYFSHRPAAQLSAEDMAL